MAVTRRKRWRRHPRLPPLLHHALSRADESVHLSFHPVSISLQPWSSRTSPEFPKPLSFQVLFESRQCLRFCFESLGSPRRYESSLHPWYESEDNHHINHIPSYSLSKHSSPHIESSLTSDEFTVSFDHVEQ